MKWTLHQKITVISLLAVCILLSIFVVSNFYALQAKALASFDPASYGLPPQIGGYQVIAAVPSENMDCAAADGLELMLYPLPDQPQTLTRESLDILEGVVGRTIQTSISYRVMTLPEVKSHVEYLNKERWPTGCTLIHKHMVTLTPKPSDPTPVSSYEPAYWGLPEVIAGYRILAVKTVENTPCLPSGAIGLTLQSSEPDMDSFLTNAPGDKVQKELEKFALKPEKWLLEYVGPGVTKESVILALRQLYEGLKGAPCIVLGGPISSLTPNPNDPITMTSYDPAYYGLPDEIAGYKLLAIKNVENSKCVPNAVIQVVLQMSTSEVGKLTNATYDKIMSELDKVGWKIDQWLIGYIEPGTSKEDIVAICAPNLDRDKLR